MKKHHIPKRDYGTHVVTVCGRMPKTLEQCFGDDARSAVCSKCKKKFIRSAEELDRELEELIEMGKRFTF